jgi:hypothetical protein
VLQGARSATKVEGVLLRADNLSAQAGDPVVLAAGAGLTRTTSVGADGHFSFDLSPEEAMTQVLELRTVGGVVEVQQLPKQP